MTESMKVATLRTRELQDHAALVTTIGQFELDVTIPRGHFLRAGDKSGMVKSYIARHLASAIMDTQVPSEYWVCFLEPEIARELNIPSPLNFG